MKKSQIYPLGFSGRDGGHPTCLRPFRTSHLVGSVSGAESTASEGEHGEEGDDPKAEGRVEVISHSPEPHFAHGALHRTSTDSVVRGEQKGASDAEDDELNQTGGKGAVDGADSPSVAPGADEHEERVECDDAIDHAHEAGNTCEVGARCLAVNVTVL